ncbi:MAG TPA: hypothetical protein VF729_10650, partial [Solirubrobacterales bacterium]
MTRATAAASARILEALSRIRGERIFHPHGVGFAGRLTPQAQRLVGAPALATESEVVVRLSRALGLPEWLPDPCGLGLRIPDAYGDGRHQDFLMVSSATAPLVRHTILPARAFLDRPYSTVLPYRFRERLIVVGAAARDAAGPGPKLAELRDREFADLDLDLAIASVRGRWQPVARLSLGRRLPPEETERLGLDPTNTGGGLELAG